MRRIAPISALILAALLASCGSRRHRDPDPVAVSRPVSLEIEVYDPTTGFVWQDVAVRIVEVDHEWSGCICTNPVQNDFYFTDEFGVVYYSPSLLAVTDLGFLEDRGLAVLSPEFDEDEATVLLEISAPGLGVIYERIDIDWTAPEVYVQIPF